MNGLRSRLYARLLSVVLLVLILPVAGLWSLGVFERELLAADERAIAVTARALAAALACPPALDANAATALLARVERPLAGRLLEIYEAVKDLGWISGSFAVKDTEGLMGKPCAHQLGALVSDQDRLPVVDR